MKYFTKGVVFSEVPDEITLELGISNCPFRCEGCHSPFLQEDVGTELTLEVLKELIESNDGISCILFSGGSPKEVEEACRYVSIFYPDIKTAWYTGMDTIPTDLNLDYFDYIKVGPYKKDLGGLRNPNTNQKLYKQNKNGRWENITYRFWK